MFMGCQVFAAIRGLRTTIEYPSAVSNKGDDIGVYYFPHSRYSNQVLGYSGIQQNFHAQTLKNDAVYVYQLGHWRCRWALERV